MLGDDTMPPDPGIIEKLNYIEAVAYETMRLKSVAPVLFIEPNVDVELVGKTIPKGTSIIRVNTGHPVQEIFSFTMMPSQLKVKMVPRQSGDNEFKDEESVFRIPPFYSSIRATKAIRGQT